MQIVTNSFFLILRKIAIMGNFNVSQNSFVQFIFQVFIFWSTILTGILPNPIRQILMSRFWDITVFFHCQVNKISALILFPKSACSTIVRALEVTWYDRETVFSHLKLILFRMSMYITDTTTNMTVRQSLWSLTKKLRYQFWREGHH